MIAADFFSGLGGFTEGAAQAGIAVTFAANHDERAVEWHTRNHRGVTHACQDLQQLDMRLLPDLSDGILIASPACQGHSQNAQPARRGAGGSHRPDARRATERAVLQRSTAWAVVAAAEEARPRAILVENVPPFLRWRLFPAWRGALEALGYAVREHVLRAADFGSPQDRARCVVSASLGAPIELAPGGAAPGVLGDVVDPRAGGWSPVADKPERMRSRMRRAQREAGGTCVWNNVSESRGRSLDERSPTLTTRSGSQLYLLRGRNCRLLEPRELARIQSFPDSYAIPEARALASHLIGNAIDVRLARGVCEQAAEALAS